MVAIRMFLIDTHYQAEEIPFYSLFAENFYQKQMLDFVKCFSVSSGFGGGKHRLQLYLPQDGSGGAVFHRGFEGSFGSGSSNIHNTNYCSCTWAVYKSSVRGLPVLHIVCLPTLTLRVYYICLLPSQDTPDNVLQLRMFLFSKDNIFSFNLKTLERRQLFSCHAIPQQLSSHMHMEPVYCIGLFSKIIK